MGRLREAPAGVGLVAASVLLCLTALELGLRIVWRGHYLNFPNAYAQPHPMRGRENRHSASVVHGEAEVRTVVATRSLGLRGPELRPRGPRDRTRVLVLGDSLAYGVGVEDDATFSARLAAGDPGLEMLDAGVNGCATSHAIPLLREVGLAVEPDLVLLTLFWNAATETWRDPSPPSTLEDGRLVDPPRGPDDPSLRGGPDPNRRPWLQDGRARRFLEDRAYLARRRIRAALGMQMQDASGLAAEQRSRAWEICLAMLRDGPPGMRRRGALRDRADPAPDPGRHGLERKVLGRVVTDLHAMATLAAFVREEGIPPFDLLPALRAVREADPDTLLYDPIDRRLTAEGRRNVSDALGAALRAA